MRKYPAIPGLTPSLYIQHVLIGHVHFHTCDTKLVSRVCIYISFIRLSAVLSSLCSSSMFLFGMLDQQYGELSSLRQYIIIILSLRANYTFATYENQKCTLILFTLFNYMLKLSNIVKHTLQKLNLPRKVNPYHVFLFPVRIKKTTTARQFIDWPLRRSQNGRQVHSVTSGIKLVFVMKLFPDITLRDCFCKCII